MKKREEAHIGFYIRTINNMFVRKLENMASKEGDDATAMMHGWFLGYLYENRNEDIYQKDLEAKFKLSKSAVTCIVKDLEKNGCIKRESVEFDARLKKIVILEKGIEIHKKSFNNVVHINKLMKHGIEKEELDVFFKVCDKIKENLSGGNYD